MKSISHKVRLLIINCIGICIFSLTNIVYALQTETFCLNKDNFASPYCANTWGPQNCSSDKKGSFTSAYGKDCASGRGMMVTCSCVKK